MICRIAPPVKGRSKMKNCKLYYREHRCWLELEEEIYLEIRRERQRVYFKKHKAGECYCRKNKLWLCDGLCETCEFYKKKELSLYAPACLSNDIPMIEYLSDMCDYEEQKLDELTNKQMLKDLQEEIPIVLEYGKLKLQGMSDREIARELNIPRTSLYRLIEKARKLLSNRYYDF